MGYKTENLKNGALLVKDVPLMSSQKLTEKHFKIKNIDRAWMQKSVDTFTANKAKGKMPYLWDRHNSRDEAAQVIGRLDNLRIDTLDGADWLFADVIITEKEHQQKFLAGKTPSKSVEFQPDNHYLRGLALLDGHEGHFDATIPDFVPEGLYDELVALGLNAECTVLCYSSANTAKGNTMTNEELLAAINGAVKPLVDKMNAIESELATVKNSKQATGDIDAALAEVRAEAEAEASVKLAKVQRDAKVTAYTAQLHSKTKTPEALLRKKLESFKSQEAMDVYFESAMKQASEDVKLGVEREHGDSPDLKAEFEDVKARYKDAHGVELRQSFDDYKRLAASLTDEGLAARNDRHSARGVTPVRATEEAFA